MLGSHTVQQPLCVCLKTTKRAALIVPEGFGLPLPFSVDSEPHKTVEAVGVPDPCGCCSIEHRVI